MAAKSKAALYWLLGSPSRPCGVQPKWMSNFCTRVLPAVFNRAGSTVGSSRAQAESPPPREFCGSIKQVKTSPMKLNLVAKLIRGMSIAQALAQLEFSEKRAANYIQMTLLDTQKRAVKRYGAKPLNLWIAESYVGKGSYLKRIRYHGKGMSGIMHKHYSHYFLKLREGKAPKKKQRSIEDHKSRITKKLIAAGPRSIPNSL